MMLLLVTTLSFSFTACGGDDEPDQPDNPDKPTNTTSVVKGTVSLGDGITIEEWNEKGGYDSIGLWFDNDRGDYCYVIVNSINFDKYRNPKIT